MRRFSLLRCASLAIVVALAPIITQAQQPVQKKVVVQRLVKKHAENEYWLGVQLATLDELTRAQLNIEHGLAVADVVADSPAATASVKKNDILLQIAGKNVSKPAELAALVNKAHDREIEIVVLRGGERLTLKLKPAKRPEEAAGVALDDAVWSQVLNNWLKHAPAGDDEKDHVFWRVQPGAVFSADTYELKVPPLMIEAGEFPANTRIVIEKGEKGPAEITARQGDKNWKVDEENLDQLPDDVRGAVERALGRLRQTTFRLNVQPLRLWAEQRRQEAAKATEEAREKLRLRLRELNLQREKIQRQAAESLEKSGVQKQVDEAVKRAEEAVQALQGGGALERIERELKQLRRDVEALKQSHDKDRQE